MKDLLLLFISFYSLQCVAQSDTAKIKHAHRFWINPAQIITGQYTLGYAHNLHGGNDWLEVAVGYQYIPYSIVKELPLAPEKILIGFIPASPKFGVGFTGPVISFAYTEFSSKVKGAMSKAAKDDPELQEIIK